MLQQQKFCEFSVLCFQFAKQTVLESYLSFVENYNASGKVIENALNTKSSVQKFIEVSKF